ncbi:uncharacterized protein LOC100904076 [Galendromus occidentalis]|uniref:Uncharacterized protein LOC100904076 n=1 Tax=Galendromus occidentalis TaxID=34638 RepID=A0AAJ6QQJ9_9ACAR|nr:uncharacterized protein LOC100904076 [Galendromus occidentalis]
MMLISSLLLISLPAVTPTLSPAGEASDERTLFYGPASEHLSQWVSYLRLKAVVKEKAYDCKRIHYCTKGAIESLLFPSHPVLDDLMRFLSKNHQGILGAMANGFLRKDCEKLYPKCSMKIRIKTSKIPCESGEACFRISHFGLDTSSDEETDPHKLKQGTLDAKVAEVPNNTIESAESNS